MQRTLSNNPQLLTKFARNSTLLIISCLFFLKLWNLINSRYFYHGLGRLCKIQSVECNISQSIVCLSVGSRERFRRRAYSNVTHSSLVNYNVSSINGIYSGYIVFIEQRFESTDSAGCNRKFRIISPRAARCNVTILKRHQFDNPMNMLTMGRASIAHNSIIAHNQ